MSAPSCNYYSNVSPTNYNLCNGQFCNSTNHVNQSCVSGCCDGANTCSTSGLCNKSNAIIYIIISSILVVLLIFVIVY